MDSCEPHGSFMHQSASSVRSGSRIRGAVSGAEEESMSLPFSDRHDAGRRLAARLLRFAGEPNLVVLALPRGGVPVAGEVAAALRAPLDVFVVRKIGVPRHEELAMGAVASGGVRVVNQDVVRAAGIDRRAFDDATERELHEVARRERAYRVNPFPDLRGATVILVDDGVATGSTMLAGIHALRQLGPAAIVAAAPAMAPDAYQALARAADATESVVVPEPFYGVGTYYEDFSQTSDDEVRSILRRFARTPAEAPR
jgi:predicted phosphoribosyltransferase